MPLEAASFISGLVVANPTGADKKSQGDDHFRLLKQVLINTFPTASRAFALARWAEKEAEVIETAIDLAQVSLHDGKLIYFDTSAGSRTYSLLAVASAPQAMIVFVDRDALTTTSVTIDGSGAELINGNTTVSLNAGESGFLYKTATGWRFFFTKSNKTFTSMLNVQLPGTGVAARLQSDGTSNGPILDLFNNGVIGVGSEIGEIHFSGKDSAGVKQVFAFIDAIVNDHIAGTQDAHIRLIPMVAGVNTDVMKVGNGVCVGTSTFPGVGKMNVLEYQVNNVKIGVLELQNFYSSVQGPQAGVTAQIPPDDTPPLVSEGTQLFTQAVTPKSATSRITIEGDICWSGAAAGNELIASLFNGSTCIAVFSSEFISNGVSTLHFKWEEISGSLTARTYSLRYGPNSAITIELNIANIGDDYGDKLLSCWSITEKLAV